MVSYHLDTGASFLWLHGKEGCDLISYSWPMIGLRLLHPKSSPQVTQKVEIRLLAHRPRTKMLFSTFAISNHSFSSPEYQIQNTPRRKLQDDVQISISPCLETRKPSTWRSSSTSGTSSTQFPHCHGAWVAADDDCRNPKEYRFGRRICSIDWEPQQLSSCSLCICAECLGTGAGNGC